MGRVVSLLKQNLVSCKINIEPVIQKVTFDCATFSGPEKSDYNTLFFRLGEYFFGMDASLLQKIGMVALQKEI